MQIFFANLATKSLLQAYESICKHLYVYMESVPKEPRLVIPFLSLFPDSVGDILKLAFVGLPVEPLVGGRLVQGTEMTDVGTDLDVVEVSLAHGRWYAYASAIPSHLHLWIFLVDVLCQQINALRVSIAPHERDAGDVRTEFLYELVNGVGIQR